MASGCILMCLFLQVGALRRYFTARICSDCGVEGGSIDHDAKGTRATYLGYLSVICTFHLLII